MLNIEREGNICIMRVTGKLTQVYIEQLKTEISKNLCEDDKIILLNLAGCGYVNSDGLNYLVELYKNLRNESKRLILSSVVPDVRALFEITKLHNFIEIYKNEKEALSKIK